MSKLKKLIMMSNQVTDESPSLPPHLVRCEYIEATGTQWIDSQCLPTPKCKIEVDFKSSKKVGETFQSIFGSQLATTTSSASNRISCIIISTNLSARYIISTSISDKDIQFSSVDDANNRHIYGIDVKNAIASLDDLKLTGPAVSISSSYPIYILSRNNKGTVTNIASGCLYGFKYWNDDILLHDYIPCFNKELSRPCMYDTITGIELYNQGTGEFAYG